MTQGPPAVHRTIVAIVVDRFSDSTRTEATRKALRSGLDDVATGAFAEADIPWIRRDVSDMGDGLLVSIPPDVPAERVVGRLPNRLIAMLRRHNRLQPHQLRLRMAVHAGVVWRGPNGVAGEAVKVAARLVDASEVRSALSASADDLVYVVSDLFYTEIIRHDPVLSPEAFRRIHVRSKETDAYAWLRVPAQPRQALPSEGADEVTIYTSGDDGTQLRDAVVELLDVAGITVTDRQAIERGSWFQRLFVRAGSFHATDTLNRLVSTAVENRVTDSQVGTAVQAGEISLHVTPEPKLAEQEANAVARLMEACGSHDEVVIRMTSLIFIKTGGQVLSWVLSDEQARLLQANPALLRSPRKLLETLCDRELE